MFFIHNSSIKFHHVDIDECTTGDHNCTQNQDCVNLPGDYKCECISGYELLIGDTNETCEGSEYYYLLNFIIVATKLVHMYVFNVCI